MLAPQERIEQVREVFGTTVKDILAKEPEHDMFEVLGAIEVLVGSKTRQKLPTCLAERMVFAFTWLAREVQNGGFHQFFFNSAGDYWRDILNGLIAIGDEQGLSSFRQVLSIFPRSSPAEDRFARQEQLERLGEEKKDEVWEHFSTATSRYFHSPFPNWQLVLDYVRHHQNEFDLQNG